jgi:xanthine dehydrogenase YagS FAD-binding subunit
MEPFSFERATTEEAALASHTRNPTSRFIAGGTTLLDLMKIHVETPELLVDINSLPLKKIEERGGSVFVGAMVANSDLAHHPLITKNFPVLSQALLSGASAQLRNLATTAGNLLQRTRCPYFRDRAWGCNKREPGTGCSAMDGFNRNNVVLGGSEHCIATHPSDMSVALAAIDAKVHTRGASGERVIPIADFYRLPGATPHLETALLPHELVTSVELSKNPLYTKGIYVKVRDRASYAFALASAAVMVEIRDKRVHDARIALGGVATVPWRSREAEAALVGQAPMTDAFMKTAEIALSGAVAKKYNGFKIALAKQTIVRALSEVSGSVV